MVCHLIGPFFARLEKERTRVLSEVVIELYNMVHQVAQHCQIVHTDTIADLLYHIKYKHVGEMVKREAGGIILRKVFPSNRNSRKNIVRKNTVNGNYFFLQTSDGAAEQIAFFASIPPGSFVPRKHGMILPVESFLLSHNFPI